MKFLIRFVLVLVLFLVLEKPAPLGATPVQYIAKNFYAMLGSTNAFTNAITLQPWPDSAGVTLFGSGFVVGPPVTVDPGVAGSNQFNLFPNQYRITWASLPYGVLVSIPDSTNVQNLVSNITSGAGVFYYTNNANFKVFGSAGDTTAGYLTDKIKVDSTLTLTTNNTGGSLSAQIGLASSNNYFGRFSGSGSNLTISASNVLANGTIPLGALPAGTFTNSAGMTNYVNSVSNNVFTNLTSLYLASDLSVSNKVYTNLLTVINTTSNSITTNTTAQINTSSNGLSVALNYNLTITSNGLQTQITAATNYSVAVSNTFAARFVTQSNALQTQISTVSNTVNGIIAGKAFSCYVPATYSSIGIGFSTPLMPDGNYSVSLVPQDDNTAGAPQAGLYWYVNSKNASGFTIYLNYATNAYNLNFDCTVKENTQ